MSQVSRELLITAEDTGSRMYVEQERLRELFPGFRMMRLTDGRFAAIGTLRTNAGNRYGIEVRLDKNHPHALPAVLPLGWTPGTAPHQIHGGLCVMKREQWRSFYSAAFVVGKAALWVNKYDVWKDQGSWPGNQQGHSFFGQIRDAFY